MNLLDYIVVVGYLGALLVMGFSMRQQESKGDYFLGGRSLGWKPLTLSVMATQLSAISFISAPAFVGLREGGGMIWLSYELAIPIAMILLLGTVLPTLYKSGVVSIYDYLEQRFGRATRVLISVVFQFSRAFATGIMIYAVSIILQGTMGIEAWQAVILTGIITVLYSLQGGMKAVVYADAIQMVIIVLGTIACIAIGLNALGGLDVLIAEVPKERLVAINFTSFGFNGDGFGFLPMLFGGLVLYASYYGCDQTQAQRALSARNENDLRKMIVANGIVRFPITLLYCFSGLIVGTLALTNLDFFEKIPANNPDWLMPTFILNYLPHGLIGLLIVAILSAAMSSLSSAINSLSAVTVEDYCRITNKDLEHSNYLRLAKFTGLVWGAITLVLSLFAGNIAPTIIEAINKVGSVFYGPILALFLLAVLSQTLKGRHVNLGLIAGVGTNIIVWLFVPDVFWFWWNVIGFVVTCSVAWVTSIVWPTHHPKGVALQKLTFHSILTWKDIILLSAFFAFMVITCMILPSLFS
ncbi:MULTISPECIES: sodium:solute symporter [Alteromonas]|jgi:sodium-coupled monocarboxylate transporter 8/12|uniref:Sodium transporter n=1 Tax=Alteromonas stellipolaris TaxID=233316 RepID=A0ABM5YM37_9ALTE|nr:MULTISPECIES: sodium:solute symporter [Alteromonas]AMJ91772.1 sodium transporter [Alteromonas sp. Mac2]ALM89380.1 sodium/iodide co-transporter [Alteromonas stellipolaris LMG 21856]AMJ75483.1 sodium transporter [Alteromonas stellipolaris]AMJ87907.1 sodium transporter [Alteromonas sp. Mac1]ANB21381.1 sodium transporter [Alteromonas stellipolaris]